MLRRSRSGTECLVLGLSEDLHICRKYICFDVTAASYPLHEMRTRSSTADMLGCYFSIVKLGFCQWL